MIALLGFRSCWSGASIALQEGKVGRKGGAAPAQKSRFLHNSNLQIVDSSNCGRSMRVLRNKFFTEASGRCSRVASRLTITSEKRDSLCDSSLRVWGFGDSLLYSRGQSKSEPCSAAANDSSNDKCEGGSPWATFDTTPTVYSSPAGVSRDALLAEKLPPPRLSIAPMMEYTDNHFRHLARLLSRHTWLYTEMVVDNTLIHQQPNLDKWLEFPAAQHPVVLQLGGSDPALLGEAARLADAYGYDEINLNCGCPSNAVAGHGCFGARLMLDPRRVSDAVASMALNCSVPVTIKCRIGVDDRDSYEELCEFVDTVSNHAPVKHFVIHARKALLKGLSPSQNRSVPPLRYEFVAALMRDFPHLDFTLNGGIKTLSEAQTILHWGFKGVMIGRAAYSCPWHILGDADRAIYGVSNRAVSRRQVLKDYVEYADSAKGRYNPHRPSLRALIMPLLGLFHGEKGGARWRRAIEVALRDSETVKDVVAASLPSLSDAVLDSPPEETSAEQSSLPELGLLPAPPSEHRRMAGLPHELVVLEPLAEACF